MVAPVVTLFPLSALKTGFSPVPKDTPTTQEGLENRAIGREGMPAYCVTNDVAVVERALESSRVQQPFFDLPAGEAASTVLAAALSSRRSRDVQPLQQRTIEDYPCGTNC